MAYKIKPPKGKLTKSQIFELKKARKSIHQQYKQEMEDLVKLEKEWRKSN